MFSSNQILKISGCLSHTNELKKALEFALKFDGAYDLYTRSKDPLKCIYQITEDGRYCIGTLYGDKIPNGWNEYPFDFDLDIISKIIIQHLEKQKVEYDTWDGTYSKGFLMETVPCSYSDEFKGIKTSHIGVVLFKPYTTFYAK